MSISKLLLPSEATWHHRSWLALVQVMAYCLRAPSHYLNQCLLINDVEWHSPVWKLHDDVIKWKHFPFYWPFVQGIHQWTVSSPYKGQWRRALIFSLICAWINGWVNNSEAVDLRHHRLHYDITVMVYNRYISAIITKAGLKIMYLNFHAYPRCQWVNKNKIYSLSAIIDHSLVPVPVLLLVWLASMLILDS